MGLVYLPMHLVDSYGKLVGKYTRPMDLMGSGTNHQMLQNDF